MIPFALPVLGKNTLAIGAALAALIVAALAFASGMGAIRDLAAGAAATARAERDAHWRAEIAASNAAVERARSEQAQAALAAQAQAESEIARLRHSLTEMEARNATLPNADACGLDRDRVRLLPR